jgi:hypothetical protein
VFTDASRYECRYSDSRGLNPGARETHLPHTTLKQSPTNVGLFSGDSIFFPYFSSFNLTHTHTFLDGMDGSTCLVRISEERFITFNRNKEEKRMKRQKKKCLEQQLTHTPTATRFNINRIFLLSNIPTPYYKPIAEGRKEPNNLILRRANGEKEFNCLYTSSNFLQMRLKALKMASVVPVIVTIRSGQDPSEMLMRAPDYINKQN